jgi:anti-sigma regulatory factor (Ser/Thr protein kinase)
MRVEYLLALYNAEPPTDRCRPVLYAISGGDRRRQREVDAARHVLECELCAKLGEPLLERRPEGENEITIGIQHDADVVRARKSARELATRLDFSRTDLTLIATAVSEIARNIVRFAAKGQVHIELVDQPRPGIRIVARDTGPGIPDIDQALADGYSTYNGLGLGLPGARRLMDEFTLTSEINVGTTVTMTKWRTEG